MKKQEKVQKKKWINPLRRKKGKQEKEENPKKESNPDEAAQTVKQMAEALGMFPSDVEAELKELQNQGLAKCYMYEGELYAVLKEDVDIEMLEKSEKKSEQKDDVGSMYA